MYRDYKFNFFQTIKFNAFQFPITIWKCSTAGCVKNVWTDPDQKVVNESGKHSTKCTHKKSKDFRDNKRRSKWTRGKPKNMKSLFKLSKIRQQTEEESTATSNEPVGDIPDGLNNNSDANPTDNRVGEESSDVKPFNNQESVNETANGNEESSPINHGLIELSSASEASTVSLDEIFSIDLVIDTAES